jgi:hypothetical protein
MAAGRADASALNVVVTDDRSGLAIYGFDPVAYFTDAQANLGLAHLELSYARTVWRFRNLGNRSAFAADPTVYMPCFGGHDPMSIGRGASAPGHPYLWMIARQRLYLFYSETARAAFAADPDRAIELALERWPDVERTLLP